MDKVTYVRKRLKHKQWKAIIKECRSSGISTTAWCKANGLNVYTYLEFLLMYMPDTDWQNHPEAMEDLMPWSQMAQEICKH